MIRAKGFISLALVMGGYVLGGCSSKAALPEKKGSGATLPVKQPERTERASKAALRESPFASYFNPEYGVSFRYPRNYALEEGAPDGVPGVKSQEELEGEQPGAVVVATVVVPDDSYPNTTFAGGSLQFAVNRTLASGECRDFLISREGDAEGPTGMATIQGTVFAWAENNAGDGNTEFFERDYAGFSNGACYEFFVRVGVGPAGEEDRVRPADEKRILSHLEKIVSSLQIQPKPVSVLDK